MAEVAGEQQFGAVIELVAVKQVHDADVVAGEAGEDLFLGVKQLGAGAVVGQAEADKAVMHQALEVGIDRRQQFVHRQVGRIENLGLGPFARRGFVVAFGVILQNQERIIAQMSGKGTEELTDFSRADHGREAVGVA